MTTLQLQFLSLKHRPTTEEQTNIIYQIPCKVFMELHWRNRQVSEDKKVGTFEERGTLQEEVQCGKTHLDL